MRGPTLSYILFELVGVRTKRHRVVLNHHFPLQLATMDKIHKDVLAKMTYKIMGRISNPRIFSEYLREIFSTADIEEIGAKENQKGPTSGTQTMLSILEKRGPKAYGLFILVLRNPEIKLSDLADQLEEEERKLRGKTGISFLLCPVPLNVLAISNFNHAMLNNLTVIYCQSGLQEISFIFRRLLQSRKIKRFLPKYIRQFPECHESN